MTSCSCWGLGEVSGAGHVTSPADVVCAVAQLEGEQLLLPWPCPALTAPSVPLEKALPLWVLSQRCCCLCSPARNWCRFIFLPKLSRIFTVCHQTPACHPVCVYRICYFINITKNPNQTKPTPTASQSPVPTEISPKSTALPWKTCFSQKLPQHPSPNCRWRSSVCNNYQTFSKHH